ncbi:hypothetical protein BGZ47_006314 [Haplosporangium gracile]|nr:hypothetical protein BGZ47_006314 [Haplosporangium gracile]
MDSTVAPVAAAEAPFDATEESVIQDPATRQTIEQLIVACFSDIGKALAAAGVAKRDTLKAKDGEDDTDEEDCVDGEDTVSLETLEEEWRRVVQPLKTRLFNDLNAIEVDLIREVFYHDRMILEAAQYYGIKPEERIKILSDKKVQFVVLGNKYEEWLAQHFKTISTRFVVHRTHEHILGVFKGQTRFTYNCHRAGKHRAQPTRVPGGASGKPRNRPASIKMNCTSQFTRMMVPKEDGLEDAATFEYNYLHNHELGATTELEKWEVANMVRLTIRSLCNMKGSIVSRVLRQLVMQFDDIGGLLKGGEQSSQGLNDDVVDCNDVYNIWYSTATETMFKDPDATLSAVKWMKALDKEQAFTYHQPSYQSGCLYFGFASRWQMQQLHDYGETLFFEGRPFAFGHNISLFSLVLKHPSTGTAIPVAFLLSKTSDAQILEDWFGAIRARMRQIYSTPDAEYDYNPAIVITNQGAMAVQVLKVAFSGVSIHYSGWHLTRLWEKDLASKLTGMEGLTAKQRRDFDAKVQAGLHTILYEMDETKAAERITQFRNKWRRQEQLLAYLNSHFFGPDRRTVQDHQTESQQEEMVQQIQDRQKRWMLCYRPDVTPANASSYKDIAPWLDSLERKCFTATPQQQHRFDTVIFILTTIAVPYFQQQCLDRMLDSDTVKAAVAAAENEKEKKGGETWLDRCAKFHLDTRESRGYSERTISLASEMSLKIESFTQPGVSYEVKMEAIKNPSARGGHYVFYQVQDHDCEHWNQKDDFEEVVEQDSEVAVHEDECDNATTVCRRTGTGARRDEDTNENT